MAGLRVVAPGPPGFGSLSTSKPPAPRSAPGAGRAAAPGGDADRPAARQPGREGASERDVRSERASPTYRLTDREVQVLRLLCRGMTAQHIGHALEISPRTAQKHLQNIYAKFGVSDRLLVAARVQRLGLVDGTEPVPSQWPDQP